MMNFRIGAYRRDLSIVLCISFFLSMGCSNRPAKRQSAPPKLIVVLAIDQMPFDYLNRFAGIFQGGFARLLGQGAVFHNAKYRHAGTETGPGHAVILSGRHPSSSGIVANDWWDPMLRAEVNVVDDPAHDSVGGAGRSASPANFVGSTLGDALKSRSSKSKVLAIAIKDRASILLGGPLADAAYWFEGGKFITSSYYMRQTPDWLAAWNVQNPADAFYPRGWTRLEDDAVYERYAGRDDMPGEGAFDRPILLPKLFKSAPPTPGYYSEFSRTPLAEEVMLQFTFTAMRMHQIGEDGAADILALGFSATDTTGHDYGPNSHEMLDQLLRLDRILDQLFDQIDRTVGLENAIIVLTSDHGALPLVEVLQEQGVDAMRADPQILVQAIEAEFAERFPGVERLLAKVDASAFSIYFDEESIRTNGLSLQDVERAAAKALMSTGLVEWVYTRSELLDGSSSTGPYFRLYRNSFFPQRSGHLTFLPKQYLTFADKGSSHGTPYDYDRHVPIIFMGPGIRPGTYWEECGPEDIAPTLARILGLDYTKEPDSRLLVEMLQ